MGGYPQSVSHSDGKHMEMLWRRHRKVHDPLEFGMCSAFLSISPRLPSAHSGGTTRSEAAATTGHPVECSNHQQERTIPACPLMCHTLLYVEIVLRCCVSIWHHSAPRRELSRKQLGSMLGGNWVGKYLKSKGTISTKLKPEGA